MSGHVFIGPGGRRFSPQVPIGDILLRLGVPRTDGRLIPFERSGERDEVGRTIWRPVPAARLAVEEAERAASPPVGADETVTVEFLPGELEALPQPFRSQHFLRRCAFALKPGQRVSFPREVLLSVLSIRA